MTKRERSAEALAELILQLARCVEAEANASDLKPAQWSALRYLAHAAPSARTNRAFAAFHQTTTGTVTLTLKTLVEKGLLCRESDPADKRLVRFELTRAGAEALADDPLKSLAQSIEALGREQRAQLADILTELMVSPELIPTE
ncbi:MAG: MarR family transcriptional regulator [Pseudomonadota bacterium]